MADRHHLAPPQSITTDRTSALVAGGLALMAVIGVASVFSDAIAAVWSPSTPAAGEPAAPVPTGHAGGPAANPPGVPAGLDADAGSAQP
jgi:hypothetical protein